MGVTFAPPHRIPRRVARGEPVFADRENQQRLVISGLQALRNYIAVARPRPWAETMLHEIQSIAGSYLVCRRVWRSSVIGAIDVFVAKPALLRTTSTSHDGVTYTNYSADGQTRTATKGPDTEEQRVTQAYLVGDLVEVVIKRGRTGIPEVDEQRAVPVDQNVDGRQWAKVPDA